MAPRSQSEVYSPRPLTEGERWTADALLDLRRRRYSPRAWRRFVRASLQRSEESRRARPELALQARRWGVTGAAAWLAAGRLADSRTEVSVPRGPGLLWWLSVWRMLDWHLGMAEGGDGVARERLSQADALTLARFWLVPLLPALRRSHRGLPALILAGGLTDWLDGVLARRAGRTRLGRDLDTMADLAFLGVAAASAHAARRLSPLGAWSLGLRYTLGVGLSVAAVFGRARRPAIRARPIGATLRVGGLALAVAGAPRVGEPVLVVGCLVPPRSTAPQLSLF